MIDRQTIDTMYERQLLQVVDMVILRGAVDEPREDPKAGLEEQISRCADRARDIPLHVIGSYAWQHLVSENVNNHVKADRMAEWFADEAAFLLALREAELRHAVEESNAITHAQDTYILRMPSGKYAKTFLRVADTQVDREILDMYFFWLIPHLENVGTILSETWSISSIALNCARLCERYRMNMDLNDAVRIRMDTLTSYHDGEGNSKSEMRSVFDRISKDGQDIVVIMSAVMTGNALQHLRQTVDGLSHGGRKNNFRYVSLFKLCENVDDIHLCDLSKETQHSFVPQKDSDGLTVIEIDARSYLPLRIETSPLPIFKRMADNARPFFENYQNTGAITLHRDAHIAGRSNLHRGVYIDVTIMMTVPYFTEKMEVLLRESDITPKMIVHPPHDAGREMARFAKEFYAREYNENIEVFENIDLKNLSDRESEIMRAMAIDDPFLIIDDVSVTGDRFGAYEKHLREHDFVGRRFFLVGAARSTSVAEWQLRTRHLKYRTDGKNNLVLAVETVILPDWTEETCPWCEEYKLLQKLQALLAPHSSAHGLASARIRELEQAMGKDGLTDNAVWHGNTGELPRFTKNSVLFEDADAKSSDVIAAGAAALQGLRTRPKGEGECLGISYPHLNVLKMDDYLGGDKFTDLIIRFAILRGSFKQDLTYWRDKDEKARAEMAKAFFVETEIGRTKLDDCVMATRLEFLLAVLARKIPMPSFVKAETDRVKSEDETFYDLLKAAHEYLSLDFP